MAHFACIIPNRGKARVDAKPSGVWVLSLYVYRVVQSSGLLLMSASAILLSMGQSMYFEIYYCCCPNTTIRISRHGMPVGCCRCRDLVKDGAWNKGGASEMSFSNEAFEGLFRGMLRQVGQLLLTPHSWSVSSNGILSKGPFEGMSLMQGVAPKYYFRRKRCGAFKRNGLVLPNAL